MMGRREFLRLVRDCVGLGGAACVAQGAAASSRDDPWQGWSGGWPLWLSRAGQQMYIDARTPAGYQAARYMLRDVKASALGLPDPWLLRALSQMQVWWAQYGRHIRLDITSGLRTAATNAQIEGAARASLHLPRGNGVFHAVDFRPGSADIVVAAQWARAAGIGGLGIYLERDFLHADTGRLRHWFGR